jgi:hypothetical protein
MACWRRNRDIARYLLFDRYQGTRHAGTYVAKILNGTRPGDLPIEQASKFTLVVNLKTANALGIAVPPTLLSRWSDAVIEFRWVKRGENSRRAENCRQPTNGRYAIRLWSGRWPIPCRSHEASW